MNRIEKFIAYTMEMNGCDETTYGEYRRTYLTSGLHYKNSELDGCVHDDGFDILLVQHTNYLSHNNSDCIEVFVSDEYDEHQYFIPFNKLKSDVQIAILNQLSQEWRVISHKFFHEMCDVSAKLDIPSLRQFYRDDNGDLIDFEVGLSGDDDGSICVSIYSPNKANPAYSYDTPLYMLSEQELCMVIKDLDKKNHPSYKRKQYVVDVEIRGWASQIVEADSEEDAIRIAKSMPKQWGTNDYEWHHTDKIERVEVLDD